jgi:predicted ATPase
MGGRADEVFFVDLSLITDPRLVPDTIASALLLRAESVSRPVLEILTDLRNRSLLLTTTFHVGGLTSAASA